MTVLVLVRHAESVWHAEDRYAGSSDIALTERGKAQANELARWAAAIALDAVYSSNMTRAIETAERAALVSGLTLQADARLREVDFGAAEGLTRAEIAERLPIPLADFVTAPARSPFPGGESGMHAIARATPALDEISQRHPGGVVLVVMHSTLLRLLIANLIGLDPDSYRRVFPSVGNCSLNTLEIHDGVTSLLGFNQPLAGGGRS